MDFTEIIFCKCVVCYCSWVPDFKLFSIFSKNELLNLGQPKVICDTKNQYFFFLILFSESMQFTRLYREPKACS